MKTIEIIAEELICRKSGIYDMLFLSLLEISNWYRSYQRNIHLSNRDEWDRCNHHPHCMLRK